MSNPDDNFVTLPKAALQYQGFDPKIILKQMIKAKNTYETGRTNLQKWDLANISGNFAWTDNSRQDDQYTDKEAVTKDAHFLIFTFLSRSNHISKTLDKSISGLDEILSSFAWSYHDLMNCESRDRVGT